MKRLWGPFRNKFFRWGVTLLTLAFSVLFLGYQVYSQRDILLSHTWVFYWEPVLFSFLVFSIELVMIAIVWVWIVNSFGAHVDWRRQFRYFCISNLARRLPGTVWYIAYRAHFYRKEGISIRITSLATAVEFAISVVSASLVSLIFAIPLLIQYPFGLVLAGLLMMSSVIFLHPRVIGWLLRRTGQDEIWYDLRQILQWSIVYFFAWIIGGVLFFLTANILYPLEVGQLGYVIGAYALIGLLGRAITFLPSNLGLQEVGYSLLLIPIMPASIGIILAILNRILMIAYEIIWALLALVIESFKSQPINPK